jgi:hypothetical protein
LAVDGVSEDVRQRVGRLQGLEVSGHGMNEICSGASQQRER